MNIRADEPQAIAELTERLERRFPGVPAEAVRSTVDAAYREFSGHPVRDFVPVLVERQARQTLTHRAA